MSQATDEGYTNIFVACAAKWPKLAWTQWFDGYCPSEKPIYGATWLFIQQEPEPSTFKSSQDSG